MPDSPSGGLSLFEKKILSQVYCLSLRGIQPTPETLAAELGIDAELVGQASGGLVARGLLERRGGELALTDAGRSRIRVVLVGGVFDIIHPGHIRFLGEARALGDVVLVSVARDKTVLRMRGRGSLNHERARQELVQSIRLVDLALLGSETDIMETVERTRPDIILLGYDQAHSEHEIEAECARRGVRVQVVRAKSFVPGVKTSRILEETPQELKEI